MTVLAVIPARWASSRFPGKPLAEIAGRPMIAHVWDQVAKAKTVDTALLATDDQRIFDYCVQSDIAVEMTSAHHATGTDRLAEVASQIPADIIVNVQGDEPLIDPRAIDAVVQCLIDARQRGVEVSTAYIAEASAAQCADPSVVHLVPTLDGCVLTFSRYPVPFHFAAESSRTVHLGLYAFTPAALAKFAAWERGPIECAESIELMRFLEHGERIAAVPVPAGSIGVDTPADAIRVEETLKEKAAVS